MYPNSINELLEALTMQEANIATYKNEVGATSADITENLQDRANMAVAVGNAELVETNKQVTNQIKNAVYNAEPTDSIAPYPAFALTPLPFPEVIGGALMRYLERRRRFKAAKGYTKEIGIALGLEKPDANPISPSELTAAAKLKDAGNYQFEAEFKKQGMSGMAFQYRVKGTEKWSGAFNALQSPVLISIEHPSIADTAIQIEIRCRLLQGNNQVGEWSPIYLLTVNP